MMAVDMGGPVNKAAYTFAVGTILTTVALLILKPTLVAGVTAK
ncbi:hypothetical protein [Thiocapsa rosea]|uniref:Uncharacterized protein n=1 Tax=Thiocapsa rosea TaxID=69360 RepID=A0A495V8R7_9GAMM|nr:hypothetical protein [Thiocapsa rosea]RKT44905.1 hypothetical protein BDD21_2309 [Thiocapsa rosea]